MRPARSLRAWLADETGVMTGFGLLMLATMLMVSAYAVDYNNAVRARTKLQVNTDATAHAALVSREFNDPSTATSDALQIAYANMPQAKYGNIVQASDIVFGDWDASTRTFTADASSRQAVRVTMHQTAGRSNPVGTFLFRLVGVNYWNINTTSVFEAYYRKCLTQGFVSNTEVDIQSNNNYLNDFCIHSNDIINIQSGGYWEQGTMVTMPQPSTIELPSSGFTTDVGLQQALTNDSYHIRILDQLDTIYAGLTSSDSSNQYIPSYITNPIPIHFTGHTISSGDLTQGNIYTTSCDGSQPLNIQTGTTLSGVVLVTNCLLNFGANVQLQNAVVFDTNTSDTSISAAYGVTLGLNDNCATGGGAQMVTLGGVSIPASLNMYGGQIIAKKDVDFAANANGIQGASIVAGGTVSGTSNMTMAYCPQGMEQNFQAEYFRMVQ